MDPSGGGALRMPLPCAFFQSPIFASFKEMQHIVAKSVLCSNMCPLNPDKMELTAHKFTLLALLSLGARRLQRHRRSLIW
jgi:hypothetical protein